MRFSKLYKGIVLLTLISLFTSFFMFPLASSANPEHSWYIIGDGPLKKELGYPIRICSNLQDTLYVLDGLKSCISSYNIVTEEYINGYQVYLPASGYYSVVQMLVSADNDMYLRVDNYLYIYSSDGTLKDTYQLNSISGFVGMIGNRICPLSNNKIVFKEQSSGITWLGSLEDQGEPAFQLTDNEGSPVVAIDICRSAQSIYVLSAPYGNLNNSNATLYCFDLEGNYKSHKVLEDLSYFPTNISVGIQSSIALLCSGNYYYILDTNTLSLHSEGTISTTMQSPNRDLVGFCGNTSDSVFVCDPFKGVEIVTSTDTKSFLSVSTKPTIAPYRVTGDTINIFTYDLLSNSISYYRNDALKESVPIQNIIGLVGSTNFGGDIQLFFNTNTSIYIAIKHISLSIIRYDFETKEANLLTLPSYIPPKGSMYYLSEEKTFYLFSWFDGLLYSFDNQGKNVTKLAIPSMKSQSFSDQCIICVDESHFTFVLMPILHKVRVLDRKGFLVSEFSLPMKGVYSDIALIDSKLCLLNSTNGSLYFCTKRGEELYNIGQMGVILYPEETSGYQSKKGFFNYPSDLHCVQDFLYVADTGNSRIQILSIKEDSSKPVKRTTIVLQIGSKSAYIDGIRVELDVPPFTKNGRTLVPFRFIGEALSAEVKWDAAKKMASYVLDGNRVDVILGNKTAYVNGKEVLLDVAPLIQDGRTFVPIRFVTEALGASVVWEANTKKIYITYPGQ